MANRGMVFNNSVGSVNLFPWVQYDSRSRGQFSRNPLGGATYLKEGLCLSDY